MNLVLERIDAPLRLVAAQPFSIEDFWRISADNDDVRLEREPNGDLTVMSPTLGGSGYRSSLIDRQLGNWAEADGTGVTIDSSTACQLPDGSIRSAVAAWIRLSRWMPPSVEHDSAPPCPDFVIELRSKSDQLEPLQQKMAAWIANGELLAWLIDPRRKMVEIYRPGQEAQLQEGRSAVFGEGPVAGFVLELGRIWG